MSQIAGPGQQERLISASVASEPYMEAAITFFGLVFAFGGAFLVVISIAASQNTVELILGNIDKYYDDSEHSRRPQARRNRLDLALVGFTLLVIGGVVLSLTQR